MLYRIKFGDRECHLVRGSDQSVINIARGKMWSISPGESILVYRGSELIARMTRESLFNGEDRQR